MFNFGLLGAFFQAQGPGREVIKLADGCRCQGCGEIYREDVLLSDELWDRIRPEGKPEGAGLLCGACIGRRLTTMVEIAERSLATTKRRTLMRLWLAERTRREAAEELLNKMTRLLGAIVPKREDGGRMLVGSMGEQPLQYTGELIADSEKLLASRGPEVRERE